LSKRIPRVSRTVYLYGTLPVIAVVVLLVGWMVSTQSSSYVEERAQLMHQFDAMVYEIDLNSIQHIEEFELILQEGSKELRQEFFRSMTLAMAILLLGVGSPLLATGYFVKRLQADVDLLNDQLSSSGSGGSALMPQTFNFLEFDQLSDTLPQIKRNHGEIEQRWKRAEKELICVNFDLVEQVNKLKAMAAALATKKKEIDQAYLSADKLPLRIAVAEDNLANQRVIMIMLRRLGWAAQFAENGEELLELVRDQDFDLIFMDLQMPKMDGLEATRLIRAGEAGEKAKQAKIVALTANALAGDEARCLRHGMDAYLSKPLKLNTLKHAILRLYEPTENR